VFADLALARAQGLPILGQLEHATSSGKTNTDNTAFKPTTHFTEFQEIDATSGIKSL
jgi:hypothetical protein